MTIPHLIFLIFFRIGHNDKASIPAGNAITGVLDDEAIIITIEDATATVAMNHARGLNHQRPMKRGTNTTPNVPAMME